MAKAEQKTFATPDETRVFENGKVELVHVGESDIGRLTLEPGWRWSEHVKPIAGTDSCEAPHFQYHVAGTLRILMDDGHEFEAKAGDVQAFGVVARRFREQSVRFALHFLEQEVEFFADVGSAREQRFKLLHVTAQTR